MDEAVLDMVRQHMRGIKAPQHHDRVYKDECMFCFAGPESPGGLYINLTTHQVWGRAGRMRRLRRSGMCGRVAPPRRICEVSSVPSILPPINRPPTATHPAGL